VVVHKNNTLHLSQEIAELAVTEREGDSEVWQKLRTEEMILT